MARLWLFWLLSAGLCQAQDDALTEHRLRTLSAELRCLVCQNQSLADSHADLAIDLRNQVRDQIKAGKTDEQIKDYLVQRYGDFVLYRPPVKNVTMLLWVGPFAMLLLGALAMFVYLRRRRRSSQEAPLSDEETLQARSLLQDDGVAREESRP